MGVNFSLNVWSNSPVKPCSSGCFSFFFFLIFKIINSVSLLVNRYLPIFRFFLSQSLGLCHLGICLFHLSCNSLAYSCFVVSLKSFKILFFVFGVLHLYYV